MSNKHIEFFNKESGRVVENPYLNLFIFGDGSVWQDNLRTCESQDSVVGFDDFIEARPTLDWRIKSI